MISNFLIINMFENDGIVVAHLKMMCWRKTEREEDFFIKDFSLLYYFVFFYPRENS